MILVVGATGVLGSDICRRLVSKGMSVRGLVRASSNRDVVDSLRSGGVETVEGDLRKPASLLRACNGVRAVISTATTTHSRQSGDSIESTDEAGQLNLVQAARESRVAHFTYVSYSGGISTDDPLTRAKRAVERAVQQSGMRYTILRPTFFMEVWLSPALGFDYPNAKATIYGDGHNKVSWISLGDVATFAVETLDHPSGKNAVLELGGPEALSPLEVVRIFEQVGSPPFEVQTVPEAALQARREAAADSLQETFAALMLTCAQGDPIPMDRLIRDLPVELMPVRDYAEKALRQGVR